MQVNRIQIQNFLSYKQQELDIDEHNFCLIIGDNEDSSSADSNGAGKSAIFEAICWCLFGRTVRGAEYDDVINEKAGKNCKVVLDLTDGSTNYKIVRGRKTKEGNTLAVFQNGKDISKSSVAETEKLIEQIIGMNYQIFINSVVFPQGSIQFFASLTDKEQKQIIEKALGFDQFPIYQNLAKQKVNKLKNEIGEFSGKIAVLEGIVKESEVRIERLKADKGNWLNEQRRKIEDKKAKISEIDIVVESLKEKKLSIKKKAHVIKNAIVKRETIEKSIKELESVIATNEEKRAKLEATNGLLKSDRRELGDRIQTVQDFKGGAECPFCGQSLTGDKLEDHIKRLKKDYDDINERIEKNRLMVGKIEKELREKYEELNSKKKDLKYCFELVDEHRELMSMMDQVSLEISECMKLKERLNEEINELREQRVSNPYTKLIEQTESQLFDEKRELKELKENCERLGEELKYYQFWVEGFGNKGLKSFIFDCVVPFLNERTNYYSKVLTDGLIQVYLSTQSRLKSGELRDKFEVRIEYDGEERSYKKLSGGEKRKVDLSILMALRDLVKSRSDKDLGILFCDEIFDVLDESGIERAMELLYEESLNGCRVFVISHDEGLKEYFNDVIVVMKRNGESVINEEKD